MRSDLDQREYIIRDREGDYFLGWRSTEWETVKRFALWTKIKREALKLTLRDLPKNGYMELVCGFSGLTLERVKVAQSVSAVY